MNEEHPFARTKEQKILDDFYARVDRLNCTVAEAPAYNRSGYWRAKCLHPDGKVRSWWLNQHAETGGRRGVWATNEARRTTTPEPDERQRSLNLK